MTSGVRSRDGWRRLIEEGHATLTGHGVGRRWRPAGLSGCVMTAVSSTEFCASSQWRQGRPMEPEPKKATLRGELLCG